MPDISFPNLGIEFETVSKVAIKIFNIDIMWYAIFITMGVLLGLRFAEYSAKKSGQDPDLYFEYFMYAFIAALIGARIYYVIFDWETYKDDLIRILAFRNGGLAIYGGIIASVITAIIFTKKKKVHLGLFLDTAAPSLALGQAIGRWGNLVNREAFGRYTNSLLALRYVKDQVDPSIINQDMIGMTSQGIEYIQVHPTFLYESLWNIALFIILIILRKKKKFDGQIVALYFFGYGIGRAWIEGLRTDQLKIFGLAVSQILSIVLVVVSGIYIFINLKKVKDKEGIKK